MSSLGSFISVRLNVACGPKTLLTGLVALPSLHAPGWKTLPYGYVKFWGPRQAAIHSDSEHRRLLAEAQASAACTALM